MEGSLFATNGGEVNNSTFGQGDAGNITINARDNIALEGQSEDTNSSLVGILAERGSEGDTGNIQLSSSSLSIKDGAFIRNDLLGQGIAKAGDITIDARDNITIDGVGTEDVFPSGIYSRIFERTEGKAGNITVDVTEGSLVVTNGGEINTETRGTGNGGNITINVRDIISLEGQSEILNSSGFFNSSTINSRASFDTEGNSGNIRLSSGSLSITGGALISNSIFGLVKNAGNININVRDYVSINGVGVQDEAPSGIFNDFNEEALGNSGEINIRANSLRLSDGGQVSNSTRSEVNAGRLLVTVNDSLEITDPNSGIFNRTGGTGNAGEIEVKASDLRILNNAEIGVNNFIESELRTEIFINAEGEEITRLVRVPLDIPVEGSGNAGTIKLTADSIRLEQNGRLGASSVQGGGGNINIESNILSLLTGGNISTEAGVEDTPGQGGDININSQLIFAYPGGDSDIVANAFSDQAGNISIETQGIFGIEERLELNSLTNDITASSGVAGTPGFDPTSGLLELPQTVSDASDQISQNPCEQGIRSEFLVTGKGGLPVNPQETLNSDRVKVGLIESVPPQQQTQESKNTNPVSSTSEPVPAQGWVFNDKGNVIFTAYSTEDTPKKRSEQQHHTTCSSGRRLNP